MMLLPCLAKISFAIFFSFLFVTSVTSGCMKHMQLRINVVCVYEREGTSETRMVEDTISQSRKLAIEQKNRMIVDTNEWVSVTEKRLINFLFFSSDFFLLDFNCIH